MKLVMKLLFLAFIIMIIMYVTQIDILGPRIMLVEGETLDFSLGQEVEDWNNYFYLDDREEGPLDNKYMTIFSEDIDMEMPGVQYLYIKATDKAGNVNSRSFEIRVSSGYQHFNFENFINNDTVTADMRQLEDINFIKDEGINSENSNASIAKYNGSQALKVALENGARENGIKTVIDVPNYKRYYLQYDVNVISNNVTEDIYIPTLASDDGDNPVSLMITTDNNLKVINNNSGFEYIIPFTKLNKGTNTIQLELSVGDKLGGPDYVAIRLNGDIVYAIDDIDFGFDQIGQVNMSIYTQDTPSEDYDIYIDNVKFSMVNDDLIG